jgi:5'-nucleotidase
VSGTPSDCVVLALSHLMKQNPPDLILSGVNSGSNTGDSLNTSGTAGAAFTGLIYGVPAIALSLAHSGTREDIRWETARAVLPDILANFLHEGWDNGHCLSINIPDLPPEQIKGICWTHLARKTTPGFTVVRREDLREKDYFWIYPNKSEGVADSSSDTAALARGQISITALTLDRSLTVMTAPFGKKTANDE